jgi:nicotinamidase-related amidase
MKVLIVVDMQNDFIDGSLGSNEAQNIVPNVINKIKEYENELIYFTKDTHFEDYLDTPEGKKLPVKHCIKGTTGWNIPNEILGNKEILATSSWPNYEDSKLVVNTIEMAVQVNGKLRGTIKVNKDEDDEVVKAAAFELDNVKSNTEGKEIKKVIVVKNRIVNIVAI